MRIVMATVTYAYPSPSAPAKAVLTAYGKRGGSQKYRIKAIDGFGRETKGDANTLSELTGKEFPCNLLVRDVEFILDGGRIEDLYDNPADWTFEAIRARALKRIEAKPEREPDPRFANCKTFEDRWAVFTWIIKGQHDGQPGEARKRPAGRGQGERYE